MRGVVAGLSTPHPIGAMLPGVYQEDDFTMRFTSGLDDVLAPVLLVLDCLESYIDPLLAPPDFLDWLARWVGVDPDEDWPDDRRRAAIAEAVALHSSRGTAGGLRDHLGVATGGIAEVVDSGGVTWSTGPTGQPETHEPSVHVRVGVRRRTDSLVRSLEALLVSAKPAYVRHTLEVVEHDRLS
ncbi:phage tail protein I [Umezawaea sp. Da 62-37]|uniref:phage tail protein I n=1 Tax=Umezawaea sp. Da 62-37 TaxID=3075927 RepID=UPI0028F6CF58|nr:phage tail protein I [Umezawaea sp. Da 62-37]WNV87975.1 phage tail protein I [Umezawaea sp. Da 62-37]